MEGKTRHLQGLCCRTATVTAVCQRDIEDLGGPYGVLRISLIEIAATKQQHGIRVLRLDVPELLHHRC